MLQRIQSISVIVAALSATICLPSMAVDARKGALEQAATRTRIDAVEHAASRGTEATLLVAQAAIGQERATVDLLAAVKPPPPPPPRALCKREVSGLDHDVDLGLVEPCPHPEDGQCVAGVPLSVAEAHCRAGKV